MYIIRHNTIIQMPKFNPYFWIHEFPAVDRLRDHSSPSYKT